MRHAALTHPGPAAGPYPERTEGPRSGALPSWPLVRAPARVEQRRHAAFVARVNALRRAAACTVRAAFQSRLKDVRARLAASAFANEATAEAFALVREATRRQLGLAHYDTQLIAGKIMLGNQLAEMATGEGKTLTAALAAATAAFAGMPVHLITANDYLVTRDAELLAPIYRALGLSVGTVTRPMDMAQRRLGYGCDITYCTAKELVFDYLRDRLVRRTAPSDLHERVRQVDAETSREPRLLLRGLWVALIDEADSILIDEARTPLVLSQSRVNPQQQQYVRQALEIAGRLRAGTDFRIDLAAMAAELTDAGRAALAAQAAALGGLWQDRRHRDEIVTFALAARHVFRRDRHYIVRDDKIVMIDQTTGRAGAGARLVARPASAHRREGRLHAQRRNGDHRADHLPALFPALLAPGRDERNPHGGGCRAAFGIRLEHRARAAAQAQPARLSSGPRVRHAGREMGRRGRAPERAASQRPAGADRDRFGGRLGRARPAPVRAGSEARRVECAARRRGSCRRGARRPGRQRGGDHEHGRPRDRYQPWPRRARSWADCT